MAKRIVRRRRTPQTARKGKGRKQPQFKSKSGTTIGIRRRPIISGARLERGLRVLSETKDINAAARAIRVSVERFKQAASRKATIRKQNNFWIVARRLPRRMPIFTDGRLLAIAVRSRSASLIGRYMSAVGNFLDTNDPKYLAEYVGRSVKDTRGKSYEFETDPNALYRLSSAGGEPFEEIYRIVL